MNTDQPTLCNHGDPTGCVPLLIEYRKTFRVLSMSWIFEQLYSALREVMAQFSRWMSEMRLSLCDVNETLVEEFCTSAFPIILSLFRDIGATIVARP